MNSLPSEALLFFLRFLVYGAGAGLLFFAGWVLGLVMRDWLDTD